MKLVWQKSKQTKTRTDLKGKWVASTKWNIVPQWDSNTQCLNYSLTLIQWAKFLRRTTSCLTSRLIDTCLLSLTVWIFCFIDEKQKLHVITEANVCIIYCLWQFLQSRPCFRLCTFIKYKCHFPNQRQKLYHISKAQPNTFLTGTLLKALKKGQCNHLSFVLLDLKPCLVIIRCLDLCGKYCGTTRDSKDSSVVEWKDSFRSYKSLLYLQLLNVEQSKKKILSFKTKNP